MSETFLAFHIALIVYAIILFSELQKSKPKRYIFIDGKLNKKL